LTDRSASQAVPAQSLALGMAILTGAYLLLTSTVKLHETLWPYDVKRLLELCLLCLIFSAVLLNGHLRTAFHQQIACMPAWVRIGLPVFFGIGVLSSIHNARSITSLYYSLAEVALLGLLVLAVLCIAACRRVAGRRFDQAAALLLGLVALAVGMQELLGVFAAWNSGMEFNPAIALLHYSYPRFYNQVQTWSIPAIAALPLIIPGKPLVRLFCLAALGLEWYVMLATGGRGSMVSVTAATLLAVLLLPRIKSTLAVYSIAGLLGGLLIYGLVLMGHQNVQPQQPADSAQRHKAAAIDESSKHSRSERANVRITGDGEGLFSEALTGDRIWTFSGRLTLWLDSVRDSGSNPLLGIGPMNFACSGPLYRSAHPHNFPLQIASEWGIPALLLLLLMLACGWTALWRSLRTTGNEQDQDTPPLAGFLATALLAAMLHACLSGVMVMPASQVAGMLVCGWLLGSIPLPRPVWSAHYSPAVILAAALAVSVAFLGFIRQELAVAETRLEQTAMLDRAIPRLWQNGKVCRLYREMEDGLTKTR